MTIERYAVDPIADRAAWLALRQDDLTASDVGAVRGVDPHRSRLRVWLEKSGLIAPDAENQMMQRGRWLERGAAAAFAEQYPGLKVRYPVNIYLRDTEVSLGATPDLAAEDPADPGIINVQLKVVSRPVFERDWADGGAPPAYIYQAATEGMLLQAKSSLLVALVIDTYSATLEEREVPRHAEAEARIRSLAAQFAQDVRDGRQPVPDYTSDAGTIAAMYPHAESGTVLDLTGDNILPRLLASRAELKNRIEVDEAHIQAIDAEIKMKLGTAEAAVLPGWRITWKEENRKAYQVAASTRRPLKVFPKEVAA